MINLGPVVSVLAVEGAYEAVAESLTRAGVPFARVDPGALTRQHVAAAVNTLLNTAADWEGRRAPAYRAALRAFRGAVGDRQADRIHTDAGATPTFRLAWQGPAGTDAQAERAETRPEMVPHPLDICRQTPILVHRRLPTCND